MTTMLVSVAEVTNVISVVAILLCFAGMVLFIMRNMTIFWLHGEDLMFSGAVHGVQAPIPQMKMMKVHIPFTFKLQEPSKSSYQEIKCMVSSQEDYRLLAFWGVSIRELHMFLWRPWSVISSAINHGALLMGHYQQTGCEVIDNSHRDKIIKMSLPNGPIKPLDLGTPPRLCYPLVVFLVREPKGVLHPDETVALINVIHIKDSVCTLPTSILAQYLKQANGQLSCLKQLYLATGNPIGYDSGFEFVDGVDQLCVVCQYYPLSRALLPCRHTCICASCFNKLDTCPMCRSPIKSYFCIRNEEYLPDGDRSGAPSTKPEPIAQWLQDRLTDFLGFHR